MVQEGDSLPAAAAQLVHPNGDTAEFDLQDATADGPAVLAFFPLAFSGVCTTQVADIQDNWYDDLREVDVQVYGVSVDSPFALAEFVEQEELSYPLVSDFDRAVVSALDLETSVAGLDGVAKRAVLVVDADGTVTYADVLEDASEIPDMAPVHDAVTALVD